VVAKDGEGVDEFLDVLEAHRDHLEATGMLEAKARTRYAEEIRTLLREDLSDLVEDEIADHGGMAELVEAVVARETDPYAVAADVLAPVRECVDEGRS
jgi:LAO/AO transport system kinase